MGLLLFPPRPGYAGFLNVLFPKTEAKGGETTDENLQNVPVLASNLAPKPDDRPRETSITIVEDEALVPEVGPMGTEADIHHSDDLPDADQITLYTVHSGDTVTSIAKMFDIDENTIRWENNLKKGEALKVGAEILVLPVTGIRHTVLKGETLDSIAKKYKGDIDEIKDYNDLLDARVSVGEEIIIPGGEISETPKPSSTKGISSVAGGKSASSKGYIRPLNGIITQYTHDRDRAYDIAKAKGSAVVAAASGKVTFAAMGWNGGFGGRVTILHPDGITTTYSHLSEINVKSGESVSQGQTIGKVGSTGRSTGPHLHFAATGPGSSSLVQSIYAGAPSVAKKK